MKKISDKQFNQAMRSLSREAITPAEIEDAQTRVWAQLADAQERKTMPNPIIEPTGFRPSWLKHPYAVSFAAIVLVALIGVGVWYQTKDTATQVAEDEVTTQETGGTVVETTTEPTSSSTPTSSASASTSPSSATKTYVTDKGTVLSIEALAPSGNAWQQVAEAHAKHWLAAFVSPTASAAEREFLIDYSKNFNSTDSFKVISRGKDGSYLLGGGTNAKRTIVTTDFESLADHDDELPKLAQSVISAADFDGSRWLVGVESSDAHSPVKLYSFDGEAFTDISNIMPPSAPSYSIDAQVLRALRMIESNGREWMLTYNITTGGNYGTIIQKYDGVTATDISNLFPDNGLGIAAAASNGTDWFFVGHSLEADRSVSPPILDYQPLLYKYSNGIVTDLSADLPRELSQSRFSTAIWNEADKAFYFGGDQLVGQTGNPDLRTDAWLVKYDGITFTDLSASFSTEGIYSLAANDQGEVMVGGHSWDHVYLYRNGVAEHMPLRQVNAASASGVRSIAANGRGFLLGGWYGTIIKVTYN